MTLNKIKEDLEAMGVRYKDKDFQDPHANIRNYSNIENTIHSLRNNKRARDIILVSNLAVNSLGRLGDPSRKEVFGEINQHDITNIRACAMLLFNGRTKRTYVECRVYLCNEKQSHYSPSASDYDTTSTPPHVLYRWNDKLTIENKDGTAVHIRV